MHVKQGWSGEVETNKWAKISVDLDDGDLARLLREAQLDVDPAMLPVVTAYGLLEAEAERLVLMKLMVRHNYPREQGLPELAELEQTKNSLFDLIRSSVAV